MENETFKAQIELSASLARAEIASWLGPSTGSAESRDSGREKTGQGNTTLKGRPPRYLNISLETF